MRSTFVLLILVGPALSVIASCRQNAGNGASYSFTTHFDPPEKFNEASKQAFRDYLVQVGRTMGLNFVPGNGNPQVGIRASLVTRVDDSPTVLCVVALRCHKGADGGSEETFTEKKPERLPNLIAKLIKSKECSERTNSAGSRATGGVNRAGQVTAPGTGNSNTSNTAPGRALLVLESEVAGVAKLEIAATGEKSKYKLTRSADSDKHSISIPNLDAGECRIIFTPQDPIYPAVLRVATLVVESRSTIKFKPKKSPCSYLERAKEELQKKPRDRNEGYSRSRILEVLQDDQIKSECTSLGQDIRETVAPSRAGKKR